jgi:Flp pilus assembly protein TadG
MKRLQKGTTSIEFAIIGGVAMLVMLGVIELSRLMFVMNAMNESTRRGARVAVVCTIGDPAIARAAVFNSSGGNQSPIIRGLSTDNINVRYLNESGAPITDDLTDPSVYVTIHYVQVQIQDYQHQIVLPLPLGPFNMPPMTTTLPRESLGVTRAEDVMRC